jgi:hypothetical protein
MRYHHYPDAALKLHVQFIREFGLASQNREEHRKCCADHSRGFGFHTL